MERKMYYLHFPTEGGAPYHAGLHGNSICAVRRQKQGRRKHLGTVFIGVSVGKCKAERGKQFRIGWFEKSSGLRAVGLGLLSLALKRLQGNTGLVYELNKLDPSGLPIKGLLLAEPPANSKNWLALGGPCLLGQQDF